GDFLGEIYGQGIDTTLANPYLTVKLTPEAPEKLTPLVEAVNELSEEEPRLGFVWESSTRELSINVSGEVQIEIISALLSERFNLKPHISPPSVIYRETPTRAGIGYEAYTMPKPCWAIVQFRFEPLPRGSGVVYDEVERLPVDQLHPKYRAHIKTSFYDSLKQGIKGWEVTDFKATLTGGEHHLEHTHPLDFFVATPVAFLNGLVNCGTTYLEPMLLCRISIPEEHLGKVLGDIVGMRGEFDTPVITSGVASIECKLPVASSFDYPVKLASLSGGKARFYSRFDSWRDCPDELCQPTPYRGVCPLDRARWILYARGAYQLKLRG
nr:TetM/TetW/TetO/TetS family tetracycline resistance ribosomal protection protein [Clostridia bacterium]